MKFPQINGPECYAIFHQIALSLAIAETFSNSITGICTPGTFSWSSCLANEKNSVPVPRRTNRCRLKWEGGAFVFVDLCQNPGLFEQNGVSKGCDYQYDVYKLMKAVFRTKCCGALTGECWAFCGGHGHLTIGLSQRINVSAVASEHLPVECRRTSKFEAYRAISSFQLVAVEQVARLNVDQMAAFDKISQALLGGGEHKLFFLEGAGGCGIQNANNDHDDDAFEQFANSQITAEDNDNIDSPASLSSRKRRGYTIEEKIRILDCAKVSSIHAASRRFSLDRNTIRGWKKQEGALRKMHQLTKRKRLIGGGRKLTNAQFDEELSDWLTGNLKAPPMDIYLEWIASAWESIPKPLIEDSFLTCGITKEIDGRHDEKIHVFKKDGAIPNGLALLKQRRKEDAVIKGVEEIDLGEDESDASVDI
ncbi:hypothetical protein niasHS_004835 [Heterodera schachtii]|uniref:HTH psq-type domain-containing protein n=1 Tax=Heterodera schachtii TaxID=97005 RepID=A0ABD2JS57_HETSC